MTTSPLDGSVEYRCPGERYPISRSIHLARLAAFYPKCRECVHGGGACGSDEGRPRERAKPRAAIFRANGVRGRYLNEIDRTIAGELAGAFASLLWEQDPPQAGRRARSGPTIVVGYDERPASPDLVTGVALALRRMGCQVIDVGLTTRPCFWFAVQHLHATAGVMVSGSGQDPSETGLDFVGRDVVPASSPGLLDDLETRWTAGFSRSTRSPATQRTFQAWVPYETGLWKHFHALRPLRVVVGCPSLIIRELLDRLFQPLACRLTLVPLPVRSATLSEPRDSHVQRVGEVVREEQADVGFAAGDDGQLCVTLDEQGELVPPLTWLDFLSRFRQLESRVLKNPPTFAAASLGLRSPSVSLAGDVTGYVWFNDPFPTSDAVVTIARSLQALSHSDAPVSEAVAPAPRAA